MAHAILVHLDGVQADVQQLSGLLHRYLGEVDDRLPVLRILRESLSQEVLQQLGQQNATKSSKQLKGEAAEVWAQLQAGASQHLSSLLAAHQLLVAVSDMCQQAADTLMLLHTNTQPLLLSSSRELVTSFMQLLCATSRMALLVDELPRRLLAVMLHICHQLALDASAARRSADSGNSSSAEGPEGLPNTDLPIYHAPSMVQLLQQVMFPVTPRVQQIMELSVAPAWMALFPSSPITASVPASGTTGSNSVKNRSPTGYQQLPPIFYVQGSKRGIELETAGISSTGSMSCPAWMPMEMRTQLNRAAGATSRWVRMGPGGFTVQEAQQLCLQYGQYRDWILLAYLVCPGALAHENGVNILSQLLMSEVRMQLWEERCCWVGLLHMQSLTALTCVPQYGPRTTVTSHTDLLLALRQQLRASNHTHVLSDARAAVQQAVQASLQDSAAWQRLLRGQCTQQLQRVTAACKAEPELLSSNILMLLALLSISRHLVAWHFRHVGTLQQLPEQLRQLAPHAAASSGAANGVQTVNNSTAAAVNSRLPHTTSNINVLNASSVACDPPGQHSDAGATGNGSFTSALLPPRARPPANAGGRHASIPARAGALRATQSCIVAPNTSDAAVAAAAAAASLPVGGRAAGSSLPAQRTDRLLAGVMAAFGRPTPAPAPQPDPAPHGAAVVAGPAITGPVACEECEELMGVLQLMGAMQDLTELLVQHSKSLQDQLKEQVLRIMQQHVIPGRVRLTASKLSAPGLATTQHDVQLLVQLVEQAQLVATGTQQAEQQRALMATALAHTWRTMLLHTLLLPRDSPASTEEEDNNPADQTVKQRSGGGAAKDVTTGSGWGSRGSGSHPGIGTHMDAPNPTALHGADAQQPQTAGQQHNSGGGAAADTAAASEGEAAGNDNAANATAAGKQENTGSNTAQASAACPMWAGLGAAQLAAITQDPIFLASLQQVAQLLEWSLCPGSMLSDHASLHTLAHYPQHLLRCLDAALMQPRTFHLALGAMRSLHWVDQQERASSSHDTTASDPHSSTTSADVTGLAADLSKQMMSKITARLSSCIVPLLAGVTSNQASLRAAPTGVLSTKLWSSSPSGISLQHPLHEAMSSSTASTLEQLCVTMASAGQVQITPQMSVVPLEYLREVLRDAVLALLTQMAAEVPPSGASSGLQGCLWRPSVAHGRVQELLQLAAHLQPLLGVQLQLELTQLLYSCAATADSSSNTQAATPQHRPVMAYIEAIANWCTRCVLQDVGQSHCVYSPSLCAFLSGGDAVGSANAANKPPGDAAQILASSGMAVQMDGSGAQHSSAHGTTVPNSKLKKLKKKLKGVAGADVNMSGDNYKDTTSNAAAANRALPSDTARPCDMTSAAHRQSQRQQVVLLGLPEVVSLLQLCGPQAAIVLLSSCKQILQQCLQVLDEQLSTRQPALLQLQAALAESSLGVNTVGWGMSTEQAALQEHVAMLLGSVRGQFTAREASKVQANLAVLARCVAFREMVSQAMQQAAQQCAPAWASAMKQLAVPAWVEGHMTHSQPAASPLPTAADVAPSGGEYDVFELQDSNAAEARYAALDVDWAQCVVHCDDTDCRDTAGTVLHGGNNLYGAAKTAATDEMQTASRAYTDMWQLPRTAAQSHTATPNQDVQRALAAEPTSALQADPVLVQLLSGMVKSPQCCERWVLLPLLLGLCTPLNRGASIMQRPAVAITQPNPQRPLLQQHTDALQLHTSTNDAYLRTLRALTSAWQAAVTQVLQSPASLENVLPLWYQAEMHYLRVAALAATTRRTPGSVQQPLQPLHNDVQDTACKGLGGWAAGRNMAGWGLAFQRAAQGV